VGRGVRVSVGVAVSVGLGCGVRVALGTSVSVAVGSIVAVGAGVCVGGGKVALGRRLVSVGRGVGCGVSELQALNNKAKARKNNVRRRDIAYSPY